MKLEWLAEELGKIIRGRVLVREPLRNHTTMRVGGPADLLVFPAAVEEIPALLEFAGRKGLPVTLLGNGSNVLVRDGGIPGLVLKLGGSLGRVEVDGNRMVAEAGVLMPRLARLALDRGLTGLEFMVGIPGTAGGGVVMNAGAHGQNMSQVVSKVETVSPDLSLRVLPAYALDLGYRHSLLKNSSLLVTRVYLELAPGHPEEIRARMDRYLEFRRAKQPWNWPSAGSVFVNPPEQAAGYLLEQAGLKGLTIGGARVSEKHANFIVNTGGATAKDVEQLIEVMRQRVLEQFGIELKTEIQFLGVDCENRG